MQDPCQHLRWIALREARIFSSWRPLSINYCLKESTLDVAGFLNLPMIFITVATFLRLARFFKELYKAMIKCFFHFSLYMENGFNLPTRILISLVIEIL